MIIEKRNLNQNSSNFVVHIMHADDIVSLNIYYFLQSSSVHSFHIGVVLAFPIVI